MNAPKSQIVTIHDEIKQFCSWIEDMYAGQPDNALKTGFKDLDDLTGGLHQGNLAILASLPGMGKTAFSLNIVEHVAINLKQGVLILSPEISRRKIVERLISSRSRILLRVLQAGFSDTTRAEWDQLCVTVTELADSPIFIDDSTGLKIDQIMANVRTLKQQKDIQLVVIDCLHRLTRDSCPFFDSYQDEVPLITWHLKALAEELDIPILALCQLNHTVAKNHLMNPHLNDLGPLISIDHYADIIMFLSRREYSVKEGKDPKHLKGKSTVALVKNRHGVNGSFGLHFLDLITRFEKRRTSSTTS